MGGGVGNDDDSNCGEQTRASNSQYKSNHLPTKSRHSLEESTFDLRCNGSMYTTAVAGGGQTNFTMPDVVGLRSTTKGSKFALPRTAAS